MNETQKNSLSFWDTNGSHNLGQTTSLSYNQNKKRTCQVVVSTAPVDHRVRLKESERKPSRLI